MVEGVYHEKSNLDFSIFGWCIALSFAPSVLFSFIVSVILAINGLNIYETKDPQIEVMIALWTSILSPILFFPLLIYAAGCKSIYETLSYLKFNKVKSTYILYVIIFTALLEFSFDVFFSFNNIPIDGFSLEVREFINSYEKATLTAFAICIIAPIMEEFIFRGWLFKKLISTTLGSVGAVGIPSILFTLFHFQNQQILPLIVLLIYSLILGFIRLKTENINYSIVAHMTSNSYVLFAPIWFV
ncbi:type II CAAX endopeptidase family protein [Pseudoalteromonas sp. JC3]|uniref:CPBP family intramembrane glutamic endopeptidase n=1 Tax=Pseudoalteromonas sp. JC3 TaxID=2810196 RepID=UPI0019CF91B5|nr:type II CAAX endopeptidase family protein [Pseudoalteromonas sp. JC3]MBR8845246.1 CPBP family intramembrane metalloprotease [Pseudoalteromonas sp. JC3]WJE07881.1 type II CAAX endopeptidase family protein [Pseudoalteromonas sp. JC3]